MQFARRSAINASTEAQQQVFSLVIAAPDPIRDRFRGQKFAADGPGRFRAAPAVGANISPRNIAWFGCSPSGGQNTASTAA